MKKAVLSLSAAALALSLAACGETEQPENNIVAEDVNAMMNVEELPLPEETANVASEDAVTETAAPEPATPAATPSKPAPAKSAKAEPKREAAAEPKAPDTSCLPEHRAAGHC